MSGYVRVVDGVNYRIGRVMMWGLFVMMGVLLWSSISKTFFMQLTSIPDEKWATVEAAARVFWDEIAAESPVKAQVVDIFKKYNADMEKAGRPYRYG